MWSNVDADVNMKYASHYHSQQYNFYLLTILNSEKREVKRNREGQGNIFANMIFGGILKVGIWSKDIYLPVWRRQKIVFFLTKNLEVNHNCSTTILNDAAFSVAIYPDRFCFVYFKLGISSTFLLLVIIWRVNLVTPCLLKYEITILTFDIFISCSALLSKGTITSLRKTFICKIEHNNLVIIQ